MFLDNDREHRAIHAKFVEVVKLARREGSAVAIGHPYPETTAYLRRAIPLLPQLDVRLLRVSEMLGLDAGEPAADDSADYNLTSMPRAAM